MFGWDRPAEENFIKMQFEMQKRAYAMQFANALHSIVLVCNEPAGRILVDQRDDAIALVDITISPEFQNKGVGTAVIKHIQGQAAGKNLALVLTVDKGNPRALELYTRLGFVRKEENEMTIWMKWTQ